MQVVLHQKQAFEKVLANYRPAPKSIDILKHTPLVIFLGVTASGRNTIIQHLVTTGKYKFIVSDTTRPPKLRDGKMEQDGVNYYFRSEDDILSDLREGKFLEAEIIHDQQVSGISVRELEAAQDSGKIPVNEVDLGGTDAIFRAKPDTKFFFIIPPSYGEWMKRLSGREQMTEQELLNRLRTAVRVLKRGLQDEHFIFVVNDSSSETARRIDEQVHDVVDEPHHQEAKNVARNILQDIRRQHSI